MDQASMSHATDMVQHWTESQKSELVMLKGPCLSVDLKTWPGSKAVELAHDGVHIIDQCIVAAYIQLDLAKGRGRPLVGHGGLAEFAQDGMQVWPTWCDWQGQAILHKH